MRRSKDASDAQAPEPALAPPGPDGGTQSLIPGTETPPAAPVADAAVRQHRRAGAEIQVMLRIDRLMADLDCDTADLVYAWFVKKFAPPGAADPCL